MRTVRLEHEAEQSLKEHENEFSRFDEVYRALEWLLSNDPEQGHTLGGGIRICLHAAIWAATPSILATYSYTEDMVVIYGIKAIPPSDD